jgi:hypothetical protein
MKLLRKANADHPTPGVLHQGKASDNYSNRQANDEADQKGDAHGDTTSIRNSTKMLMARIVRSWTPEENQVESSEHQDNANIHYQPCPEPVSEEHEIYTDYDGDHRHHVKHDSYLSAHFSDPQ